MLFHGRFCSTWCVSSFTGWQWRNNEALHACTCMYSPARARDGREVSCVPCRAGAADRELYGRPRFVRPVNKKETIHS
jgi:hypothetical protein